MNLFDFLNIFRRIPKKCRKCKEKYTSHDLQVTVSDLKWEQKEKKEEKTTRSALGVTGGTNYLQITTYKVYYRYAVFTFKCPKCGTVKQWGTRYDLYDSSWGRSQSSAEQAQLLKYKISKTLGKELWNNGSVKIVVSHDV